MNKKRKRPIRSCLLAAHSHAAAVIRDLHDALLANSASGGEELAVAVKALRNIASLGSADARSKGLAKAALRRMNLS